MRPSRAAHNLTRVVAELLTRPQGWRVDDLKAELGIADRTYRKLRQILTSETAELTGQPGLVVTEVREGDATYLRLVESRSLADRQALKRLGALHMARQVFGLAGDLPFVREMKSAAADVEHAVRRRPGLAARVDRISRMLHYVPWAPTIYRGKSDLIRTLFGAMLDRRRVEVKYQGLDDPAPATWTLEPYTLVMYRDALYVIARPVGRADRPDPLTFAVARMGSVSVLEASFPYPPDFDPASYFDGCFGIYRAAKGAKPISVELIFKADPKLHRFLKERIWHPSQRFFPQEDGTLRMTMRVAAIEEVRTWVRGIGDSVTGVLPATESGDGAR
ncbi:MAG: WYL domain-containing protein [Acidobacteria bacterium]|nr:WYL domain-containing protein [Acidobacteriota bacterium]